MKKILALLLTAILSLSAFSAVPVSAEESGKPTGFTTKSALYVHAVTDSPDGEAWQEWQSVHDEDFNEIHPDERYFFLPSSADGENIDIYNGFEAAVTVNGVEIASDSTAAVPYEPDESYPVSADEDFICYTCGEDWVNIKIVGFQETEEDVFFIKPASGGGYRYADEFED